MNITELVYTEKIGKNNQKRALVIHILNFILSHIYIRVFFQIQAYMKNKKMGLEILQLTSVYFKLWIPSISGLFLCCHDFPNYNNAIRCCHLNKIVND